MDSFIRRIRRPWLAVLLITALICATWQAVPGIGYAQSMAGGDGMATPADSMEKSEDHVRNENCVEDGNEEATPGDASITIATFSDLDAAVKLQSYDPGVLTGDEEPVLPEHLNGFDHRDNAIVIEVLEWELQDGLIFDPDTAGTYTYIPVLPEQYELGESVSLPAITVIIREMMMARMPATIFALVNSEMDLQMLVTTFNEGDADMTLILMNDIAVTQTIVVKNPDHTLTLTGDKTLSFGHGPINMLEIKNGSRAVLEDITLDGDAASRRYTLALVRIRDGMLVMEDGAVLCNNNLFYYGSNGGAVNMDGGEFS